MLNIINEQKRKSACVLNESARVFVVRRHTRKKGPATNVRVQQQFNTFFECVCVCRKKGSTGNMMFFSYQRWCDGDYIYLNVTFGDGMLLVYKDSGLKATSTIVCVCGKIALSSKIGQTCVLVGKQLFSSKLFYCLYCSLLRPAIKRLWLVVVCASVMIGFEDRCGGASAIFFSFSLTSFLFS